jgi:hypothetical protein
MRALTYRDSTGTVHVSEQLDESFRRAADALMGRITRPLEAELTRVYAGARAEWPRPGVYPSGRRDAAASGRGFRSVSQRRRLEGEAFPASTGASFAGLFWAIQVRGRSLETAVLRGTVGTRLPRGHRNQYIFRMHKGATWRRLMVVPMAAVRERMVAIVEREGQAALASEFGGGR